MPTPEGRHTVADFLGRAAPRWRPAVAVAAAAVLALTVGAAARHPASPADSYTVTGTIEVGTGPDGVAVDSTSHTAYVTDIDDDALSVIDEATKSVTTTIIVGAGPLTVAADPTAHLVYVTNGGNGTVSVISETTGTVTALIAVGHGPDGVAMDSTSHLAYVANGGDGTVSAINETTGTVTATIPVGSDPDGVAVDPTTHTTYVANGGTSTVSVINETTGTVTATIPVGSQPAGVAVDPASHMAYVANLGGTVSVIDEATRTVTATVPVGSDPDGVAVDPTSHTAYVANGGASTVSVITVTQPAPVTTVTKVTSSRNSSTFGQSVTFTATVAPADGGTATFSRGSKALCTAVSLAHVSGSTYHAHCATKTLPVGGTTITAVYHGDAGFAASTGKLTETVAKAPTALTEHITSGPHSRFALSAKLTASGSPLGGQTVAFGTGKTHLCSARTSNLGAASCSFTGSKNEILRASYPGSASYRPSSATVKAP